MSYARNVVRRLLNRQPDVSPAVEEVLAPLDPPFRERLLSMYRGEPQLGLDGKLHAIDPRIKISPSQGMWIYGLCLSVRPQATLEIGMCYGFSTLFFLAALAKNKSGHHTAVDPDVRRHWHGIGTTHVSALGMESVFRYIEEPSVRAGVDLTRESSNFDVILVDGSHRFDDAMSDFYLYAPLCGMGGRVIFDDMWMPSIQTAVAFVRANRKDFVETAQPHGNICVFTRVGQDVREWDHFQPFSNPGRRS
jgi:predicted O-methyltransferase YrrM